MFKHTYSTYSTTRTLYIYRDEPLSAAVRIIL